MSEFEVLEDNGLIDERHFEALYNGGIPECDDPYDYIKVKEVVMNG